jgi:hypothetical protein
MLHETLLRGKASAVPALKAALGELEIRLGWTRGGRFRAVDVFPLWEKSNAIDLVIQWAEFERPIYRRSEKDS